MLKSYDDLHRKIGLRLNVRVANYILFSFFLFHFIFVSILFRVRVEHDVTVTTVTNQSHNVSCKVTCHSNCHMIMWSQWNMIEYSRIMILYNVLNTC